MTNLVALVLAAGQSRRMGRENKLLLPFRGGTIVEAAVRQVCAAPVDEVIVVTGHERGVVEQALAGLPVRCVTIRISATAWPRRCGQA